MKFGGIKTSPSLF